MRLKSPKIFLIVKKNKPLHHPEHCQHSRSHFSERVDDDAARLRHTLLVQTQPVLSKRKPHPDDELSDDWREGGYSYKKLMTLKNYEKHKYPLQVELLKL
jgi:hypothetical protein